MAGFGRSFFAPGASLEPTFPKIDEHRVPLARFAARTGPPGLDFGAPGRSRARFWRPKTIDFRAFLLHARARCLLCSTATKHCKNCDELHIGACTHRDKNDEKSFRGRFRQCLALRQRSDSSPKRPWSVSGPARARFWEALGRSWRARGASRSALGRHLGVHEPPRARPDASPKRP